MKKSALVFILISAQIGTASAQIYNFNKNGDKETATGERVSMTLTEANKENALPAVVLAGVTALVTVGVDLVKTAMDNRAQSYAATYNGQLTSDQVSFVDGQLGDATLEIARQTSMADKPQTFVDQTHCTLHLEKSKIGGLFRLKLAEVKLNQSKARIASSSKGKTIDMNIDISINVLYRDGLTLKSDTDKKTKAIIQSIVYTFKSVNLGESSITVHGISPGNDLKISDSDQDNNYYSDWYQMVPNTTSLTPTMRDALKAKNIDPNQCWVTVKATIKEANPYGVKAQQLSDFFKNNSGDISDFIKAWIPTAKKD